MKFLDIVSKKLQEKLHNISIGVSIMVQFTPRKAVWMQKKDKKKLNQVMAKWARLIVEESILISKQSNLKMEKKIFQEMAGIQWKIWVLVTMTQISDKKWYGDESTCAQFNKLRQANKPVNWFDR